MEIEFTDLELKLFEVLTGTRIVLLYAVSPESTGTNAYELRFRGGCEFFVSVLCESS